MGLVGHKGGPGKLGKGNVRPVNQANGAVLANMSEISRNAIPVVGLVLPSVHTVFGFSPSRVMLI